MLRSTCLYVCPYLKNTRANFTNFFLYTRCTWPRFGPPLTTMQSVLSVSRTTLHFHTIANRQGTVSIHTVTHDQGAAAFGTKSDVYDWLVSSQNRRPTNRNLAMSGGSFGGGWWLQFIAGSLRSRTMNYGAAARAEKTDVK